MGSGKTTVGKVLANHLSLQFIDLDNYIESIEKMTIREVFAAKGELYFRKKEHFYLNQILDKKDNFILSTGGGTPCYGENLSAILAGTPNVFYLKLSIASLIMRLLPEKEQRPLIKNIPDDELAAFIGKHLFERSYYYNKAAHRIACDERTPEGVASDIRALLV